MQAPSGRHKVLLRWLQTSQPRHSGKAGLELPMARIVRKVMTSAPVTLGGAVVLGTLEFVALQRSRAMAKLQPRG